MTSRVVRAGVIALVTLAASATLSVRVVGDRLAAAVADSVRQAGSVVPAAGTGPGVGAAATTGDGAFGHPDFTLLDGLVPLGSARAGGSHLVLTDGPRQVGGVWAADTVPVDGSWTSSFVVGTSDAGTATGDGFVFVLRAATDAAGLGTAGGGLGYAGTADSVGIEFDGHRNGWDPSGDHVAVDVDGYVETPMAVAPLPVPLTDRSMRVRISYDAARSRLRVEVGGAGSVVLSTPLDLVGEIGAARARVGIVAATGERWQVRTLRSWHLTAEPGAVVRT